MTATSDIADRLARVRDEITEAAVRAGRGPNTVTLVGISKTQTAEAVVAAIAAGLRHVGENRVQEAADKIPLIRQLIAADPAHNAHHRDVRFHMVGNVQTNKAGAVVGLFDCVDAVDSVRVATALSRRLNGTFELPVLLEVYVGDDARRPGLRPDGIVEATGEILELPGLAVGGLMTVAPLDADARTAFRQVREIRETLQQAYPRVHFGVLSMGMSDDYRVAIEEGSTQVRIGTALFGPRQMGA